MVLRSMVLPLGCPAAALGACLPPCVPLLVSTSPGTAALRAELRAERGAGGRLPAHLPRAPPSSKSASLLHLQPRAGRTPHTWRVPLAHPLSGLGCAPPFPSLSLCLHVLGSAPGPLPTSLESSRLPQQPLPSVQGPPQRPPPICPTLTPVPACGHLLPGAQAWQERLSQAPGWASREPAPRALLTPPGFSSEGRRLGEPGLQEDQDPGAGHGGLQGVHQGEPYRPGEAGVGGGGRGGGGQDAEPTLQWPRRPHRAGPTGLRGR